MSAIDDGGPAFPVEYPKGHTLNPGMTLRDWFAGQALAACIECHQRGFIMGVGPTKTAVTAYEMADAMLAARKGGAND